MQNGLILHFRRTILIGKTWALDRVNLKSLDFVVR